MADRRHHTETSYGSGKIHVTNLKKNFGKLEVLKDINLDVTEGEVVVLLGPSGSGKSTLLRCLNQLETATAGQIMVDGHQVTDRHTDINKVREKIGMVFQHFNLFPHMTILENMTLAPIKVKKMSKAQAEEKALALLDRVGLKERANDYPIQLSGGQKQRVAIVRALAMEPDVMLFDEPTSALDSLTTKSVLELLRDINRKLNVTIVIITHEIAVVKAICNKVAVIDASEFVEWGDTQEIFAAPKSRMTRQLLGYEVMNDD